MDVQEEVSAYTDDELLDLAKDDPEVLVEAVLDAVDNLDDSDDQVSEAPEAGKTGDALDPDEK